MPKQKRIDLQGKLNAVKPKKDKSEIRRIYPNSVKNKRLTGKKKIRKTVDSDFILYVLETSGASLGLGLTFWLVVFEIIKHL